MGDKAGGSRGRSRSRSEMSIDDHLKYFNDFWFLYSNVHKERLKEMNKFKQLVIISITLASRRFQLEVKKGENINLLQTEHFEWAELKPREIEYELHFRDPMDNLFKLKEDTLRRTQGSTRTASYLFTFSKMDPTESSIFFKCKEIGQISVIGDNIDLEQPKHITNLVSDFFNKCKNFQLA